MENEIYDSGLEFSDVQVHMRNRTDYIARSEQKHEAELRKVLLQDYGLKLPKF